MRRHDDLLKLQRYARTVNIDSSSEEGSILIGMKEDQTEKITLQRFISNTNLKKLNEELEHGLSPRSRKLYRGIFTQKIKCKKERS